MKTKVNFLFQLSIRSILLLSFIFMTQACGFDMIKKKERKTIEESFQAAYGGQLTVEADRGAIKINTHDREVIDVKIRVEARAGSRREAEELLDEYIITFDDDGTNLMIESEFEDGWSSGWDWNRLNAKFLITVPERYNLDLKTSGGSIEVSSITGDVEAKTSGGSLNMKYVDGRIEGKTSGGSITVEGCSGDIEVKTSGGGIKIGEVRGSIEARTSGGSIKVKEVMGTIDASTSGGSVTAYISEQPESDCNLSTSGGSITVTLARDINCYLNAKTSGGTVETDFPITVKGKISKTSLSGKINGGGPELRLRTSGGGIRVREM